MGESRCDRGETLTRKHDGRQVRRKLEKARQQDVHLQLPDWRKLLSAHDELPGDQDWGRGGHPRAALLLREDLPPPSQWNQSQRVWRSVCGDYQEDQTSHLQHVTLRHPDSRLARPRPAPASGGGGVGLGGRCRHLTLTSSLQTSANISLLCSTKRTFK